MWKRKDKVKVGKIEKTKKAMRNRRAANSERTVEVTVEYLRALRRAVGLHIDPKTAEVKWIYAQVLDPYGDCPDLPEECWQVGRDYFVRSPGSDVWIWFGDLPSATWDRLWKRHKSKLAFPAGLEDVSR
jgi:hypothetical protein